MIRLVNKKASNQDDYNRLIKSEYYKDFVKDINGLVKELKKSLELLKSAI